VSDQLGLSLREKIVQSAAEAERAIASLSRKSVDGILVICSSVLADAKLGPIARERKIPLYTCPTQVVRYGGLISYAPDVYSIGRRGAWYVDRILKGAKPQDLPVESPQKFDLMINLKTANAIGIEIPPEVLQRADKVIR
jgi:putative ABC transport system substrate-binding protein